MSAADRLHELLAFLRGHETTTVEELSGAFGVSRRTIFRDLARLREQGWHIHAETGPGGGVRLDRDHGFWAVQFSVKEIIGLWIAARLSASVTALPWGANARAGLDKLLGSLPPDRRRSLKRMLTRVVVGRPATAAVRAQLGSTNPELLSLVEKAFAEGRCLGFAYVDRRGRASRREVEVHGLIVEVPAWYLLTLDRSIRPEPQIRLFRLDRMHQARLLTATFDPTAKDVYRTWLRQNGYADSPNTSSNMSRTHF